MVALRLSNFGGMIPIRDNRTLPDNAAIIAQNVRPNTGGTLRGMNAHAFIRNLDVGTKYAFRVPTGTEELNQSYWMQFTDENTTVVRSPLVNDAHKRIYWADPTNGLRYQREAEVRVGNPGNRVGALTPTAVLVLFAVPGNAQKDEEGNYTGEVVTRAYCYTYINMFGEESPPGPVTTGTEVADKTWQVTNIWNPPAYTPGPTTMLPPVSKRLYRTITSITGTTTFFKVADIPLNVNKYDDTQSDAVISGNVQLQSETWQAPPGDLQGIIEMPNGIIVGYKGNTLHFSENYRPHAWPEEYQITVEYPIVGLGVFGNTLVVCTTGYPATVSGSRSSSMSMTTSRASLPCLSRKSIVSGPDGVYYASYNGLVKIGPAGIQELTQDLIDRESWVQEYAPTFQRAIIVNGVYFALYGSGNDPDGFCLSTSGVVKFTIPGNIQGIGTDYYSGRPWIILNSGGLTSMLCEWQKPGEVALDYIWKSREFPSPRPVNMAVAQVFFDQQEGFPLSPTLTLDVWAFLRGVTGKVVKQKVFTVPIDVNQSGREIRLPSGFLSDVWQFQLSGNVPVQALHVASSVAELRSA